MKKNIFVLGIGRFGLSTALALIEKGANVTIIDNDEKAIKDSNIAEKMNNILVLDTSNYEQLASTSILSADHVVVAISDIETSIMTCVNLKDLGVKNVTAKVKNDLHRKILVSLGIKDIVFPELVIGVQVAKKILSHHKDINYIYNGEHITMLSVRLNNSEYVDKDISELYNKEAYNIFAIKTNKPLEPIIMNLTDYKLQKLDLIYIVIANNQLKNIKKYFGNIVKDVN